MDSKQDMMEQTQLRMLHDANQESSSCQYSLLIHNKSLLDG